MRRLLFFCIASAIFTGCATKEVKTPPSHHISPEEILEKPVVEQPKVYIEEKPIKEIMLKQEEELFSKRPIPELSKRDEIVKLAMSYLGKRDGGDCSGFVNLVNAKSKHPYYNEKELSQSFDNARKSRAMYNLLSKQDKVFDQKQLPNIGDLVFFEDTVRRSPAPKAKTTKNQPANTKNKGKTPPPPPAPKKPVYVPKENITHVGIVTKVEADGTVEFIHHSNGKNILDYMNFNFPTLTQKDGKKINTYMKRCPSKGGTPQTQCMNIAFFVAYGSV